jgi:hypothetical protein
MEMVFTFEDDELFRTYKRLRNVLNAMNQELIRHLTRNSIQESARKLGLARGKTLVFSNPHEAAVLFDYCLYNSRSGGKTVIERYAEKTPPAPESDETTVLHAMLDSFFSVFQVRQVHKGRGVLLIEFFGKYELFLMDIGLGDTAVPDMPLAGRVLPFDDFYISSGALLPLHEEPVSEAVIPIMERWLLNRLDMTHSKLSPGLEASFSAQLIRAALRGGALETVRYSDMRE